MDKVNLDELLNYKEEYSKFVQKPEYKKERMTSLCPFHDDRKPSFSVDLKTGKFVCFACGKAGNYVSFRAELDGCSNADAYKRILREHGVDETKKEPTRQNYTVDDYAKEKNLPADWLRMVCSLEDGKEKDGTPYVKIPYFGEDGKPKVTRKRMGPHKFKWGFGSAGNMLPYGLWRKEGLEIAGSCILVEGESDAQTLWFLGYPALGIPGASTFKPEWAESLKGIEMLYIHKEPDQGGQTFLDKVAHALKDAGFDGGVETFSCADGGQKDPSALYLDLGKEAAQDKLEELLAAAQPLDLEHLDDALPVAIEGAPKNLRQPPGWQYGEFGISRIDEKTEQLVCVCRTPIILTKRLKKTDTGEEKIEVAWKRDGRWHDAIFPRSMIFQSRSITVLADKGCTVTSENAKQVVRFLGALEQENIDALGLQESTSTFGWQSNHRFLPGHAPDMVLDIEPSMTRWATAYCKNGTLEAWVASMAPHRSRPRFRFILAASFAAPLLAIIKQRIFFVYNWGGSKGGKTAALKAALSVWGDPERLMVNFNATQVGLERTASFYCDLPLGIDERQLAGNNQNSLEKIVYMIASGTGKIRGAKSGGIQATQTWRTVALATGEEPLSTETSQTGVSTRVLEIYGGPFDDEREASVMHQQSGMNCGWAGPAYIGMLLHTDERSITEKYDEMMQYVYQISKGKSGSHIAGIAAVALADAIIDTWVFNNGEWLKRYENGEFDTESAKTNTENLQIDPESWERAKEMARNILQEQMNADTGDVNENATQYIVDWILSNKDSFGEKAFGTCLGMIQNKNAYIFPSMLTQALTKAGYSSRKTLKYLADKGLIGVSVLKDGSTKNSVTKWFNNRNCRFVEFHLGDLAEEKDPLLEEEEIAEQMKPQQMSLPGTNDGWQTIPDEEADKLPFN